MPRVTVLTAIYRDEEFVAEAIRSMLGQTFSDFEYVIVDDHSVDRSRAVVESIRDPRIRILRTPHNMGHVAALNVGLQAAGGELIARLDANDVTTDPRRLEKQIAFLDAHPDYAVVGTQSGAIDTKGRRLRRAELWRPTTEPGVAWMTMFGSPVDHTGAMYRTSVIRDELGGYDPSFRVGGDAELWMRVTERYRITNLPESMVDIRIDPISLTGDVNSPIRQGFRERMAALFKKMIARYLQLDVPLEWPLLWLQVYQGAAQDARAGLRLQEHLKIVRRRFEEVYPGGFRDRAVREWWAVMQTSIAWATLRASRVRSLDALRRASVANPRMAPYYLTKWSALAMAGQGGLAALRDWRRKRRAAQTSR